MTGPVNLATLPFEERKKTQNQIKWCAARFALADPFATMPGSGAMRPVWWESKFGRGESMSHYMARMESARSQREKDDV